MFDPMSMVWATIAATVAVVAAVRVWPRSHARAEAALGRISNQWLAEQRMNPPDA
jgi:hypothetical protein